MQVFLFRRIRYYHEVEIWKRSKVVKTTKVTVYGRKIFGVWRLAPKSS
jgi:hypothetical protein